MYYLAHEGATSRSTTFCSETPFSASLQTLSCASAVPTTASTSSPTTSSTSSPTTTTLTTSDPPYNVNTITSSVMTSSFLSPTSVVHFTPLPTLLPPMTSSFLSSTSVVVRSTPVPTSTTPTFTTTRIPVSPEDVNVFLPNCTNVKCALDTAQNLSDYVSGARSFANSVTLLQGASSALDHFASFLENQSVNFSLANESASLATKIGADLTGQAGLPNENPAATSILRSIERIYAIAASTLKVGETITYESTGRGGAASNFASVIAAYNSNTSIPPEATTIKSLGFTSLDGILAGLGGSGAVIFSTFIIVRNDPFVASRPNGRGVGSELVGLTLRRMSPDGNVAILTARNLAPENEFAITWPRQPTVSSNRTTITAPAENVTSYSVNLTQMTESDAFTVQFFWVPENVNRTIDVYFIEHLSGKPPLKMADLTSLKVSLSLNSSVNSSKLFYTGR